MKAISQHRVGGPEVLETVELPAPTPAAGEVLVRVAATSVNAADWKLRAGLIDKLGPPPFTLGFDVSGVVSELGPEVTGFAVGDEVYGMVLGRSGAYAEYVVVPANYLAPKPAALNHAHAAALPSAALTAWQALTDLRAGQRILIHAAAGGVGHLAVQVAKERGAYVIATARAVNHDFVAELGADEVIDYTTTAFDTVLTDVDVVFDLVGSDYTPRSLTVLRPDGRLIDAQGEAALDDPRYHRHYVAPSGADLREISALADSGRLRPAVAHVFSMAEVAEAHRRSESGRVRGKLVLVPWPA
ncbi:NADP-dependent oxidoreductase [Nocardia inohanensis]|uniref:NADP-dependent oxidoreductase n=1 Tax=Nocardia inohanensis TaxID=209246 RepID=UPI00082F2B94|nr:NADP-dependent oxidoreductase [Nocardia inohanensis]